LILMSMAVVPLFAQTTKVRGRVLDAGTGQPVAFAAVYLEGTSVGVTTGDDGMYSLEIRDSTAKVLTCQMLGYETTRIVVPKGVFTEVDIKIRKTDRQLSEVVVKADNKRIRRILANIDANRDRNDPEQRPAYQCRLYSKIEFDLTHVEETFKGEWFKKDLGFVYDYMDTSSVSGQSYLPVMVSETVSKRYHTSDPKQDNEVIEANNISGINPNNNLLTQFTGTMHLKINFYDDFIKVFNLEFPSPVKANGLHYYNYYIIDSTQVEGRKTYIIRYHPKKGLSSPVFDGDIHLDAEDFAVRSLHARMQKGGNVNWLRDLVSDAEYTRLPDSSWFYKSNKLYADFSLVLSDSSKVLSVLGNRTIVFSDPEFDETVRVDTDKGMVHVQEDARTASLSSKEKEVFEMVDRVKESRTYRIAYDLVKTLFVGYYDIGKVIAVGPYLRLASYNDLEGFRMQLGVRTSDKWSKKYRIGGYGAYGCKDHRFKGGLTYEQMFRRDLTHKLSVEANYDVYQLGKGRNILTTGNILSSVGMGTQKPCLRLNFEAGYEHEFIPDFSMTGSVALRRYYPNILVPMETLEGLPISSTASNELGLRMRFSKDETVNRGYFTKTSLYSDKPIITLDLNGSIPGIRPGDVGYFRPEITLDWKFRLPPVGVSRVVANAGTIIGKVPYMYLHLHEGNTSFVLDKTAFSCMDYFEFASDTWGTIFWNHCFDGLLLDRIPLVNKLKLREELTVKAAFGTLSDRNNALLENSEALMAFPKGMSSLGGVPYVEVGAGLSNILQMFRVDCFWRLTHRSFRVFAVQLGFELRF